MQSELLCTWPDDSFSIHSVNFLGLNYLKTFKKEKKRKTVQFDRIWSEFTLERGGATVGLVSLKPSAPFIFLNTTASCFFSELLRPKASPLWSKLQPVGPFIDYRPFIFLRWTSELPTAVVRVEICRNSCGNQRVLTAENNQAGPSERLWSWEAGRYFCFCRDKMKKKQLLTGWKLQVFLASGDRNQFTER